MKNADDFNRPFRNSSPNIAGAAWGSDGLSRKTRSMLNICSQHPQRPHELKLHVKGRSTTASPKRRSAR
jgi:4-carboxymuconolactone decarboxylase